MLKVSNKIMVIMLITILSVVWGSTFILIKKGLMGFSPLQVGSLRIIISAIIFIPYVLLNVKRVNLRNYFYIVIFAILFHIPMYLYSIAQLNINSSTVGILNSLTPIFTLFFGIVFFNLEFNKAKISGVILGLVGAVLLVFAKQGNATMFHFDIANKSALLVIISTLCYGLSTNVLKKYLQDVNSIIIMSFSVVTVSLPASVILYFSGFFSVEFSLQAHFTPILSIVFLAVMGSVLSMTLYSYLIQISSALIASFVSYLIPFVSIFWGFCDGEKIGYLQLISLILILAGIYIASMQVTKRRLFVKLASGGN